MFSHGNIKLEISFPGFEFWKNQYALDMWIKRVSSHLRRTLCIHDSEGTLNQAKTLVVISAAASVFDQV